MIRLTALAVATVSITACAPTTAPVADLAPATSGQVAAFQPVVRRFNDICLEAAPNLAESVNRAAQMSGGANPIALGDLTLTMDQGADIGHQFDASRNGCVLTTSEQSGDPIARQFGSLLAAFAGSQGAAIQPRGANTYDITGPLGNYRAFYRRGGGETLGIEAR